MNRLLLALLALVLGGCAHASYRMGQMPTDPAYTPLVSEPAPAVNSDGGIVLTRGSIYSGRRAHRVGDHLTVRIAHSTQADSNANTTANKSSEAQIGVTAMLGLETQLADIGLTPAGLIGATAKNDFSGTGTTARQGSLTGTLTVQVVDVLPNGNLVIGGRQAVKINNEIQVLNLRGLVDPRAVADDNSVLSSQVADARIEFSGVGVVAGKQRPGWLARILDVIAPF